MASLSAATSQAGSEWQVSFAEASSQAVEAAMPEAVQKETAQVEPEPEQKETVLLVKLHPDSQYVLETMKGHMKHVERATYFMELRLPEKI